MRRKTRGKFMNIIVLALIASFIYTTINLALNLSQKRAVKRVELIKLEEEKKKTKELQSELDSIGTDAFIENEARARGYIKQNERIYQDINNK